MSFEEEAKELVDELQSLMGEPHSRKHTADFTCGSLNAISSIITPGAIPVARPCPNTHCAEIRDRISKHMNNLASGQRISASLDANKIIIQLNSNYENGTNYPRQLIIDALSYVVNTQKNICEQASEAMQTRKLPKEELSTLRKQAHECSQIVVKIKQKRPYASPSKVSPIHLEHYGA